MEIEIAEEQFKDKDIQMVLSSIKSDALKIKTLFESLIDLAKAQYDLSQINFSPFRIDELLGASKEKIENAYKDVQINIHYAKLPQDATTYTYKGNSHLMQQAFLNLIENAYKYSQDKTCTISINKSSDNTIMLSFQDCGRGIAKEEQDKIFQAFYQNKECTENKGHGIGLALTKQIIHLHKGEIKEDSTLGKGSTFTIILPEGKEEF